VQGFSKFWPDKDSDYDLETFRVRFVEEAMHEGHSTYDLVVSSQHDDYELVRPSSEKLRSFRLFANYPYSWTTLMTGDIQFSSREQP
jgi:hypothetical protein